VIVYLLAHPKVPARYMGDRGKRAMLHFNSGLNQKAYAMYALGAEQTSHSVRPEFVLACHPYQ
jgi:hypothetical protein